jgi:hypothetical protein
MRRLMPAKMNKSLHHDAASHWCRRIIMRAVWLRCMDTNRRKNKYELADSYSAPNPNRDDDFSAQAPQYSQDTLRGV